MRTLTDPTTFLSCDHWIVRHQPGLNSHSRCQRRTSNWQYDDVVVLLAHRRPLPYLVSEISFKTLPETRLGGDGHSAADETPVTLKLASNGARKMGRVVLTGTLPERVSWLLGVEFESPENFWEVANPQGDWHT